MKSFSVEAPTSRIMSLEFFLGLVSTMGILQYSHISFFLLFGIVFVLAKIISGKKINSKLDIYFIGFFIGLTITTGVSVVLKLGDSWVKRSLKGYITIAIIVLILSIFNSEEKNKARVLSYIYGIRISCFINIIWSLLQIICYRLFNLDINKTLFVNSFHMVSSGSYFRGGSIICSGLHWHPGNLAPLLVISYFLTNKKIYKIIIIIVGVLSFHSTTIVGISACIIADILIMISKNMRVINREKFIRRTIEGIAILLIGLIVFYVAKSGIISIFKPILTNFQDKITFRGNDNSSVVHLRYYLLLPQILLAMGPFRILTGLGYGCSGYMYSVLIGQYTNLETWAVESDYINNLIGVGIINSVLLLLWLIRIAKKGKKLDIKYALLVCILLLEGFGYNVQFDWVILFLGIVSISIAKGYSIFLESQYG